MQTYATVGGKTLNPRDLINYLKYSWAKGSPNATYNRDWFHTAAEKVRKNFGITNYAATDPLDTSFDYNKVDWGDIYNTLSAWQNDPNATAEQKDTASALTPMMMQFGSDKDRGIYRPYEVKAQAENLQEQGEIDAERAKQEAILKGDGSANTIAFLKQAQQDSIDALAEQAELLKQQAQASYESGKGEIEADYAGIEADLAAGVAKLQRMTTDEYAARGMAFSGALNQAEADIAAAAAGELAKAMAQKGARLGKLVNDLVAYTAQVDLNTLNNKTQAVLEYGLQIASLMDKDAQVRNDATAMLAALESKQKTLEQVAPLNEELARSQAEGDYATAQNEAAQQNFENSLKLSQLGLDERAQDLAEGEAQLKYQLAYDQLGLDKQKLVLDEMYKKGQLSIDQYDAITRRMNAQTDRINSTLKAQELQQKNNLDSGTYDPKLDLQIINNDQTPDDVYNAAQLRLSIGTGRAFTNDATFAKVLKGTPSQKTAKGIIPAMPGLLDYTEEEATKLLNLMDGNPVRQLEAIVLWALANNKGTTFGEAWQATLAENSFDEATKAEAGKYFVALANGRTDQADWDAILQTQFGRDGGTKTIPKLFPGLFFGGQ